MSDDGDRDEEALRSTEQRHRLLLDTLPHGVQANDCAGIITYSNRAHHRILGYGDGELVGKKIWDVLPSSEQREGLRRYLAELVRAQPPPTPYHAENLRRDGSPIDLQVDWSYERDGHGALRGFISVITDVTDRRAAEDALQQRTRGLAALLQVSQRLAETLDLETVLQAAVDGVTGLIGLDTAAVYLLEGEMLRLGATVPPLPPAFPDDLRVAPLRDHPHIRRAMGSGDPLFVADFPQGDLTSAERSIAERRNLRTVLVVPLLVEGKAIGAFIVGSTHEPSPVADGAIDLSRTLANLSALTVRNAQLYDDRQQYAAQLQQALSDRLLAEEEQKSLHAQLAQAQKLESIGRLAGGVAHDFNNMLSVILGHADLALEGLDERNPLHGHLVEILGAAQRSSDLTRQLIGEDIELTWLPGEGIGRVSMDPAQVDQILANLCINARDAMPGTGRITIETRGETLDEAHCTARPGFQPGSYVVIAVSDNGSGMNEATLAHAFEPFFSTKETGKGTGLGLSTVYGIVKQNGGFINVSSEPGQGTTFRIYLRRHEAEGAAVHRSTTEQVPQVGDETILLVEDEATILDLASEMLASLGYRVLAAKDPAEALHIAGNNVGKIDLLVTDVVMPGMNGQDLANALAPTHPGLKTLYISGYTANVIAHRGILREGVVLLSKPFSRKELASKVREALWPKAFG